MPSSKHRLRRSCAFCRARKIKCSNEAICEACRRQGADCIYDFESTRSKTRNTSYDERNGLRETPPTGPRLPLNSSSSASPSIGNRSGEFNAPGIFGLGAGGESVASALEQAFRDNFTPLNQPAKSSLLASPSQGSETVGEVHGRIHTTQAPTPAKNDAMYTSISSLVTQDLVGLVVNQFGSLGCSHVEAGRARFFASALALDETHAMFDDLGPFVDPSSGTGPLAELGQRQQTQLIDVWYSTHPLSFTVSKTLLLRELRDGTHDEILLAVILGEASLQCGEEPRGGSLLSWAANQLQSRHLQGTKFRQNGKVSTDDAGSAFSGMSTRIFHGIATAQALVILGWNSLTSGSVRRAMCYIGLAGAFVTDLKHQIATIADPKASSRINGIDVFEVEKELVDHLYWTTNAICLWAFVQTGNQQLAPPLPVAQPSIFVTPSGETSAVIKLDKISGNFNTLHSQTVAVRDTWPLAHITSVVAYICTFYPVDSNSAFLRGSLSVAKPREAERARSSLDYEVMCHEVSRVLLKSIDHFKGQTEDSDSHRLVLTAYQILSIHFFFLPSKNEEDIASGIISQLCSAADEILSMTHTFCNKPSEMLVDNGSLGSLLPGILTLGIDTCVRALCFTLQREEQICVANSDRLESLAQRMYTSSKSDLLGQNSTLREVRKRLKGFVRSLHENTIQLPLLTPTFAMDAMAVDSVTPRVVTQNATDLKKAYRSRPVRVASLRSSASPHLPASISAGSTPNSDHLSQASTATMDTRVLLSPPQEMNKLASPVLSTPAMPPVQHPTSMPLTSMAQNGMGILSPADLLRSSWQPMGSTVMLHTAEMLRHSAGDYSQGNSAAAVPRDMPVLQDGQWLAHLSDEAMMDIDMATSMAWNEWPAQGTEAHAGASWDMDSATS